MEINSEMIIKEVMIKLQVKKIIEDLTQVIKQIKVTVKLPKENNN